MTLSKVAQRLQLSIVILVFLANAGVSAATDGHANRDNCRPGLQFHLHINCDRLQKSLLYRYTTPNSHTSSLGWSRSRRSSKLAMNVSDVSAIGSNCFTQMLLKLTFEEVFFVKVRTCVVLRSMAFNVCRW